MKKIIKAGMLVSYDYEYLKISLPRIYPYLNEIILCIDSERKTWGGEIFEIKNSFWKWLEAFDVEDKISIYQDSFYLPGLSGMECDTRERRFMAEKMGNCDWYIQIDSDEYFLDFPAFLSRLETFDCSDPVTVNLKIAPLFKIIENGFLLIRTLDETLPFATNRPDYTYARFVEGNRVVFWDELVLHQSWARNEDEIKTKLNNWSHKNDFNTGSYFNLWKAIDSNNYIYIKDFHPLEPPLWSSLNLIEKDICGLLEMKDTLNSIYCISETVNNMEVPPAIKKKSPFSFWK